MASNNGNADSTARILAFAAIEGGQTSQTLTATEKIGGISAGTTYPEGTPINKIITDLFSATPTTDVTIGYGATNEIPTSINELTIKHVASSSLVGAYEQHIAAGDPTELVGQYPVFAVPTGYTVTKWAVKGLDTDIPHALVVSGDYNIYYITNKSYDYDWGGVDYIIYIQEA